MGDNQRIYPADNAESTKKLPPPPAAAAKPAGTYAFQYPKQQAYTPTPQRRPLRPPFSRPPRRRRNPCLCCFCWILALLVLLIVIVAIAGAVFYLLYKPQAPKYDVQNIAVKRFSFGKDQSLSAEFDVIVQARNPNKNIGLYYGKNNRLAVLYGEKELCSGGFPAFYQGHRNTTVFKADLAGSGVRFSQRLRSRLSAQQAKGKVPLDVEVHVPAKIKVWGWKSPKVTVNLRCSLTVDKLAAKSNVKIGNKSCKVKVKAKVWKFTFG